MLITDSFGRAWRHGQTDVAIGLAGMAPLDDWRGRTDSNGLALQADLACDRRRGGGRCRSRAGQGLAQSRSS